MARELGIKVRLLFKGGENLEWEDFLEKEILKQTSEQEKINEPVKKLKDTELERSILKIVVAFFSRAIDKIVAH